MTRKMKEVRGIVVIIVAAMMFRCVSAGSSNHTVGGLKGWSVSTNLQAWSSSSTFHAGDFLVFKYRPIHDVLEVNQLDFAMCRTINPISTHNDGQTVIQLSKAGTRYFICGRRGHCARGLKVRIQVVPQLATNSTSPSPSPPAAAGGGRIRGSDPPKKEKPIPTLAPQSRVSPGPTQNSSGGKVEEWWAWVSLISSVLMWEAFCYL